MVSLLALPEGGEWIVILVIVVLLFGAKKLPELTKNAAKALNEFNKVRNADDEKPAVTPAPAAAPAPAATPAPAPAPAPASAAQPAAAPQDPSVPEGDVEGGGPKSGGQ
jgi:sec-independent protein translocase protein TatA